jgi:hypothetical protein
MKKVLVVAALLIAVASPAFAGLAEEKAASEATRQAFSDRIVTAPASTATEEAQ